MPNPQIATPQFSPRTDPSQGLSLTPFYPDPPLPNLQSSIYNLDSASMDIARISDLLAPFLRGPVAIPRDSSHPVTEPCHPEAAKAGEASPVLSPTQLQDISTYIDILLRWNARINLTAVRDPEAIVTRHFGESLFAARHLFPQSSPVPSVVKAVESIADLGSGAGFPGLPIKLWAPHLSLTLIESNHKKAAFLREVTRTLRLTDVNIQNQRAENLTGNRFDVVTLRAVERFETVLPIASALVALAGRLALLIGASQQAQAQTSLPQFLWSEPVPFPNSSARILLTGRRHS